jgi:hypothetical protein
MAFSGLVLAASLLLQRFGIPAGDDKSISIVGPIGLAIAAFGLLRGTLAFDRGRLAAYLTLVGWAILGAMWHELRASSFDAPLSFQSLGQFLLVSSFATLSFAQPVDEQRFFRLTNAWLAVIAVAGLLQFAAQFVGVRVFAFSPFLPHQILLESDYNLVISTGVGSIDKSNGFFAVEPSVFSQLMAMALIIEILALRRLRFLMLFAIGLMLSFSGTGWIVLASFVLAAAVSLGGRGLVIAVATLFVLGVTVGVALLVAPDLIAIFSDRISEFSRVGTSGYLRFVTPFRLVSDVLGRDPSAALFGIGSGASQRLTLAYEYSINTPIKIAIEYGFPALLTYVFLFILGRRTVLQGALLVPGIVLLLFAGGYQQFPPVLFPILLIISVAQLRPGGDEVKRPS